MKKQIMFRARQGDVLIERVQQIPAGLVRQVPFQGRIVLAHGEATGHHHSIVVGSDPADWWKDEKTGDQFLEVIAPAKIEHQEHGAVDLTVGKYRVRRQKEYSPAAIRNVAD